MRYKVFLVEDEIVAREGIRDNVDWGAAGFDFCGEAPDGEIALPLIEETKPDVLITDIKMPFMDGLQLSRIVREHMPWVKIIIFSGYDEFEYAQAALKIGVTDYLLKPVRSSDILAVLTKVAAALDQEIHERENLKQLKSQVEYNLQLRKERFLLRLVMGGISSGAAIEQGQQLGLNLVAQHYQVLLITLELYDESKTFDYNEYQRIETIVAGLTANNPELLVTKKDIEEFVLILKGDNEEQLRQDGLFWAELIAREIPADSAHSLVIEMGSPQNRLSDLHRSFAEALARTKNLKGPSPIKNLAGAGEPFELQKLDHGALENYLRFGDLGAFDGFFKSSLQPVCEAAVHSDLVLHYLFLEIILTIAQFVSDVGGENSRIPPEIQEIEEVLKRVTTLEKIRAELKQIISSALTFRDNQANHQRLMIIQQAKAYIDQNFTDPQLQMSQVADKFNLSHNHFSTIFKQEIGVTFRDYLNNLRIRYAKELLRRTNLKCADVAYQSGYNDAHYFSAFFKKKTGFTPLQFRELPQAQ